MCRRPRCSLGRPLRVVKKMRGFFLGQTIAQSLALVGNAHYSNARKVRLLGIADVKRSRLPRSLAILQK